MGEEEAYGACVLMLVGGGEAGEMEWRVEVGMLCEGVCEVVVEIWELGWEQSSCGNWFMRQEGVLPAPTMRMGVSISGVVGVETLT